MKEFQNRGVLSLRVGELVEVCSEQEILATLDSSGRLEFLPFMPEMLRFCGQRFRVLKRADKTCDTISGSGGRRLRNTVHLEHLRCNGEAHGGCQATCLIFWKEAWLKRVPQISSADLSELEPASCTIDDLRLSTRAQRDGEEVFCCQATELTKASSHMRWWDVRQYWRDLRSGNV